MRVLYYGGNRLAAEMPIVFLCARSWKRSSLRSSIHNILLSQAARQMLRGGPGRQRDREVAAFGVRVIAGDVRTTVCLGYAQIRQ